MLGAGFGSAGQEKCRREDWTGSGAKGRLAETASLPIWADTWGVRTAWASRAEHEVRDCDFVDWQAVAQSRPVYHRCADEDSEGNEDSEGYGAAVPVGVGASYRYEYAECCGEDDDPFWEAGCRILWEVLLMEPLVKKA